MSDAPSEFPDASSESDVRRELSDLRRHAFVLLICLVVASLTLTAYLAVQGKRAASELDIAQQEKAGWDEFAHRIQGIFTALSDYGKSHPDFSPVLVKHASTFATVSGVPAVGAAPVSIPAGPIGAPPKK